MVFVEYNESEICFVDCLWVEDIAYDIESIERFEELANSIRNGKGLYLEINSKYNNAKYVLQLQMLLMRAMEIGNYEDLGLQYTQFVTGLYDFNTEKVVKWFQTLAGFRWEDIDGIAGPKTISVLCEYVKTHSKY
jgi:hypothetical protein